MLILGVHHRAQGIAHAPLGHHAASHVGGTLEVVAGAGRHLIHKQLFGNATTEQHSDVFEDLSTVHAVTIFLRQLHGHTQRAAARDDGDLVHRIGLGQEARDDGVARFVIRGVFAFVLGHDHRPTLGAHHDLVFGALEIFHIDQAFLAPSREQRGLVDQIG